MEEKDNVQKKSGKQFRMGLRLKLISITSLIVITAMLVMIFLATYFFKKDNEIRVTENNLKISEVIALKVRADFLAIVEKLNLMSTTLTQEFRSPQQKKLFTDLFFSNDKDFIYVGIANRVGAGNALLFRQSVFNQAFLEENKLSRNDVMEIARSIEAMIAEAIRNEASINNISDRFKIPVIAVSLPFHKIGERVESIMFGFIKLDRFLQAFKTAGITETFMVNSKGDVLAHPDGNIVLSRGNYLNVPIVSRTMKSKLDNGQTRYKNDEGVKFLGSFKKIGFAGIGVIATAQEDKAFAEVYRIQRRNIFITIIVLNIAILIVYFFGKSLTTPIIRLLGATKEIEQGNFKVSIRPSTNDEIGDLTSSFISMGQGLEEREKLKETFGKFVNKEIAEQVIKGEIKLGGERKNAAVFFSDIRSFTAISEKLQPEEVVEFLNEYMTRMVQCVNDTFGVVDKYIGDAIMAIWGAPVSHGNDTENAVIAALMMRQSLIEFNKGRGDVKKPIIKIGCGINTGPCLAGQIGSEDRMEYTVIGDTVNLASRIEALNKPFGSDILITQDSYNLVKDIFSVVPMQQIKVKGKDAPQQIYAVLGKADDPFAPSSMEQLRDMLGIVMPAEKPGEKNLEEGEVKYEIIE